MWVVTCMWRKMILQRGIWRKIIFIKYSVKENETRKRNVKLKKSSSNNQSKHGFHLASCIRQSNLYKARSTFHSLFGLLNFWRIQVAIKAILIWIIWWGPRSHKSQHRLQNDITTVHKFNEKKYLWFWMYVNEEILKSNFWFLNPSNIDEGMSFTKAQNFYGAYQRMSP